MEKAYQLLDFFPHNNKEERYINFLWTAFEKNYNSKMYHFSFLSVHMLMMSYVYLSLWRIKNIQEYDFKNALLGFGKGDESEILNATSPFAISCVNESRVLRLLKLIQISDDVIKRCKGQVNKRNNAAHANSIIFFSTQSAIDDEINTILEIVSSIQNKLNILILTEYEEFLKNLTEADVLNYQNDDELLREGLIRKKQFSLMDLKCCKNYDIKGKVTLSQEAKKLHKILSKFYEESSELE